MRTVFARFMYVDGEPGKMVRIIDERRGYSHVEIERADLSNLIEALRARLPKPPDSPDTLRMVISCDCGEKRAFVFNRIPEGNSVLDTKIEAWKREHTRSHEKDGDHDERVFKAELRA